MHGIRIPQYFGTVRQRRPMDRLFTVGRQVDEKDTVRTLEDRSNGLKVPSRTERDSSEKTHTGDSK